MGIQKWSFLGGSHCRRPDSIQRIKWSDEKEGNILKRSEDNVNQEIFIKITHFTIKSHILRGDWASVQQLLTMDLRGDKK